MGSLKKCPFCGGSAHVHEDMRFEKAPYDFPKWFITCYGCGIRTPTTSKEVAVKLWNRRLADGL